MSGLVDSLNYSKFDFVDSDDEDYVEKVVMKKALGTDTNSTSVRNQAAHALAKKGKLDGPSAVDKTIQKTRTKMEQQLEELKAQMEHIDRQTSKLRTIDNPDDALKFMESSGLKPEDIQRMVEKSGFGDDKSKEINETVDKVAEVSKKISTLNKGGEEDALDSDDEVENEGEGSGKVISESKKKTLTDFEKAFKNNQAANSFSSKGSSDPSPVASAKKPTTRCQHTVEYTDATFTVIIMLPSVTSMSSCTLEINSTCLKLKAVRQSESDDLILDLKFKNEVDEDNVKAKFSKKNNTLKVSGFLA
ncbi:hypothetical protein TrST_g9853 [Triparma strigata]|uniref:PIH1D1/2/3 CS-like domain-containing protein n=1 Tax=Triparma strigata TaxID=1606541 RepID=A0A9W7AMC2_9STRA|nr:hypothetical protein TrST_g9853 [Triparma strigata]